MCTEDTGGDGMTSLGPSWGTEDGHPIGETVDLVPVH